MSNIDTVRRLIGSFEAMKVDELLTCFTEDAEYRVANHPVVVGKQAIEAALRASPFNQVKGMALNIKGTWEKDNVVACELELDYTRSDGSILKIPCLEVFRMAGSKIRSMRVYLDPSPLGSPAAA